MAISDQSKQVAFNKTYSMRDRDGDSSKGNLIHTYARGHSITTWTRGGGWVVSKMSTNVYEG